MQHWEDDADSGGICKIRHTFAPLQPGHSYKNQTNWDQEKYANHPATGAFLVDKGVEVPSAEDLLPRTHCIVWVYSTYTETTKMPGGAAAADSTASKQNDEPKRAFLIGSRAVDIGELLDSLVKNVTHKIECKHNFNDTNAIVTIHRVNGVDYTAEKHRLTGMIQSGTVVASSLAQLEAVLHLVKLQEGLISTYCVDKVQGGVLRFADSMGGQFLKLSTFLQLFGAGVCFSDMTEIVRSRVVEFPMHLIMVFAFHSVHALGLDVNGLIERPNDTVLIRFFKVNFSLFVLI